MRKLLTLVAGLGLLAGLTTVAAPGEAADHLDAPQVARDGRTDVNDLYVFQSPENPDNTVLVMTVNPGAGAISGTTFRWDGGARYDFLVDDDGDTLTDTKVGLSFGRPAADGSQRYRVHWNDRAIGRGTTGAGATQAGDLTVSAGLYDDPFFFDLVAFQNTLAGSGPGFCSNPDGSGTDFFAGLNVSAIVVEVPSDLLGGDQIGVWARTKADGRQIDRIGRPAINTVLVDSADKNRFNRGVPFNDNRVFGPGAKDIILALSGLDGSPYSDAEAQGIVDVLFPDVMTVDTTSAAGFNDGPLNGRQLADDVIDLELVVVTGGFFGDSPVLTTDCVDANDLPFPGTFPYLAAPHAAS